MKITYCDFCGEALPRGVESTLVHIGGRNQGELCENCAKELAIHIKSARGKTGTPKKEGA
jgi:hypothetical protein